MKKSLILSALLVTTALFSANTAMAKETVKIHLTKNPPMQEKIYNRPDFADIIMSEKNINLSDKQKKDIRKVSKKTQKKVRKLDKEYRNLFNKIENNRDEKLYATANHYREIQDILTDNQKEQLYKNYEQRLEERYKKFKELKTKRNAEIKQCNCGPNCKCPPKTVKKGPKVDRPHPVKPQPVKK